MVVGLTGGIGSGKTTVAKMFSQLGVSIYNSDQRAKALYTELPELKQKITAKFGAEAYVNNHLNAPFLAQKVFTNPNHLKWLNATMHPLVAQDFNQWVKAQNSAYVIKEAAILFESGAFKGCDVIITVSAPQDERIARVIKRDSVSKKQVEARLAKQLTDAEREKRADYVINNTSLQLVTKHVLELHQQLLNTCANE